MLARKSMVLFRLPKSHLIGSRHDKIPVGYHDMGIYALLSRLAIACFKKNLKFLSLACQAAIGKIGLKVCAESFVPTHPTIQLLSRFLRKILHGSDQDF